MNHREIRVSESPINQSSQELETLIRAQTIVDS